MQKVLIDTFTVPEESKSAFLERAQKVQRFLKTLPGFVEGFLYEQTDGQTRFNFVTTAVWEDEEAYENAHKAVAAEFAKTGFTRQETQRALKIESERGIYSRTPY
jgi:heme-degrading monooxygenase HmoA